MTDPNPSPVPVLLWHPDGQRVARRAGSAPTLALQPGAFPAEAAREAWQLEVWTLHDGGLAYGVSGPLRLQAVTECLPAGWTWEQEDTPTLPGARRWQRPGWRDEALGWLAARGVRPQSIRQVSTSDLNTVLDIEADGHTLFLKVSETSREADVTASLAGAMPELVPPLVAANDGWLLTETGGTLLRDVGDVDLWEEALRRLSHFQTSADAAALAAHGCPTVTLAELTEQVDALLADSAVLTGWGLTPEHITPLQDARPQIRQGFTRWAELGLPELPAHGDAHPRNVLHGERGAVWFDWSEAKAAAPLLLDLGWFLFFALHPSSAGWPVRQARPDLGKRLTRAYAEALGCPAAAARLSAVIPLALLGRAAIYDATFRKWEGTVAGWRPGYVPYYLRQAAQELELFGPSSLTLRP